MYASLALALVLIYRATEVINFAQGEMAMFATYIAWALITHHGFSYWRAFFVTLAIAFVGGVGLQRVVIRPLARASVLTVVMATIALLVILNGLAAWIWSPELKFLPSPFPTVVVVIGGVHISKQDLGTFGVSLGCVRRVRLFFRFTKLGLAMRAGAVNPDAARLLGVRTSLMLALGWGFAAVLGAVSGMMVAPTVFLTPNMMQAVLIYAFAAAVLGGLDSPVGAVVGGLMLGVMLNLLGAVRRLRDAPSCSCRSRSPSCSSSCSSVRPGCSAASSWARMRRGSAARSASPRWSSWSSLAPFVFTHYRTYRLAFVADLPDRAARAEHPHRVHRPDLARPRRVHGRSARTRRRSSSSTTAGATSGRSRSRASSPASLGLAFGLPATRFAGPYLALATFAIPLSFIGLLKRFPHFTGGDVGKNLPQLRSEFGLHSNPSLWFYVVSWVVALVMLPLAFLVVRGRLRPRVPRGARQRDRLDRERRLDRGDQDGRIRDLGVLLRGRRRRSSRSASPT